MIGHLESRGSMDDKNESAQSSEAASNGATEKPSGKAKKKFAPEDATIEGKKQAPLGIILIGCGIVVAALAIASLCIGRYSVDLQTTFAILTSPFTNADPTWTSNDYNVIMNIRLPRVCAAFLVGASLALSGASYQGVFQNPLVSPDILGVSYGACVGAALSILLSMNQWETQLLAFVGGLLTGLFCVPELSWTDFGGLLYTGNPSLLVSQFLGIVVTLALVVVGGLVIGVVVRAVYDGTLRVSEQEYCSSR